jgi:Flp pilus assembly CpaF family ATPase
MKILIMGLPGAGKTTLSKELVTLLPNNEWFNNNVIRQKHDDWDFSNAGRIRQCQRMIELSNNSIAKFIICDFIAPTAQIRSEFNADFTVFVDTIQFSKYRNTNEIFEPPLLYDIRVTTQDATYWANRIKDHLTNLHVNTQNNIMRIYEQNNFY